MSCCRIAVVMVSVFVVMLTSVGCKDEKTVFMPVGNTNQPPEVAAIPDQNATEGSPFSLDVSAYVTDEDDVADLTFTVISGGGSYTGTTYLHTFTSPGTVSVKFLVTDTEGLSGLGSFNVDVAAATNNPPTISIDPLPDQTAALNQTFVLNVAEAGNITDDRDRVDDLIFRVTSGTGEFTGSVYLNSFTSCATHTIGFEVEDSEGEISSSSFSVVVHFPPVADFLVSSIEGSTQTVFQFSDDSYGIIDAWAWDFDDDGAVDSNEQNPQWTFTSVGVHTIRLAVAGPGGTDIMTKTDLITVHPAPESDFTCGTTEGGVTTTFSFTNASTGIITGYEWDFGTDASPATADTEGPHDVTYSTAGTKTVSLTVTGLDISDIEIKVDCITVYPPPQADFTCNLTYGGFSTVFTFAHASTGTISTYAWDFGADADPPTADTEGPHDVTYSSSGQKSVTLTVTGPGGSDSETKTDYITVYAPPVADFTATPDEGSVPLIVSFTDASTGVAASWEWDFENDGIVDSTAQNPTHTYNYIGHHTVKLTVTNASGSDVEEKSDCIVVNPVIAGYCATSGSAEEVCISGSYAYVADGNSGLHIIDISNPESPIIAGTCDTTGYARGVTVSGSYAYVADDGSGLQIIDISNPASPVISGTCYTTGNAYGVAVSGSYAYVAIYSAGLKIIDISNPANPSVVGECATPAYARDVAVSGSYAYVADSMSGLQIISICNPASPFITGACDTSGTARAVAVSGNYACIADGTSGLKIIDISNPASPSIVGSCPTQNNAWGIEVSGTYAYVADMLLGLTIIDISNPASPSIFSTCDTPGGAAEVTVSGSYAYVADDIGLQIMHAPVRGPSPTLAGSYDTPGCANDVYVSLKYAYVADGSEGLQILDISDPADPAFVGACATPGSATSVRVSGSYAYVADGTGGLQVIDISNPASPSIVGSYDTPDSSLGIFVSGLQAYVADYDYGGLQILSVSEPATPTLLGSWDSPSYARGVYVSGPHAYVADEIDGLQIVNISNPASPTVAGSYNTTGWAFHVTVSGTFAYIADGSGGNLQIIDVSNSASPSLSGTHDTPGNARSTCISGFYAYVADESSGLQIVDVSNPASPELAGSYDTTGSAYGVHVIGPYAYIADGDSGLKIIRIFK